MKLLRGEGFGEKKIVVKIALVGNFSLRGMMYIRNVYVMSNVAPSDNDVYSSVF